MCVGVVSHDTIDSHGMQVSVCNHTVTQCEWLGVKCLRGNVCIYTNYGTAPPPPPPCIFDCHADVDNVQRHKLINVYRA